MNVKIKNTPIEQSRARIKPASNVSFSLPSESLFEKSPFNKKERPLKSNSQNLSFEGLFYTQIMDAAKNTKVFNAKEILDATDKYLGPNARDLFDYVETIKSNLKTEMFENVGGNVTFRRKSVPHLIYDGLIYPVTVLPIDIISGTLGLLKKIKPLEKWAERVYEKPFLKDMRKKIKTEERINTLRGTFEFVAKIQDEAKAAAKKLNTEKEAKLDSIKHRKSKTKRYEKIYERKFKKIEKNLSDKLFTQSVKMFDPMKGNYNTKHERSLNRVVSGAVPAVFLANDAYNLSRMCDDNKSEANKERKIRLKQEISRIGVSAYITLVTMGALQKYINNSKAAVMLTTGSTVLFTEMFSRLTNGKHINKLTPQQAKAINAENGVIIKDQIQTEKSQNTQEYKQVFFKSFDSAKNPEFKGFTETTNPEQKKEEPLLNFKTIAKACAVIIAAGFGIKGLRKIKAVDSTFKSVLEPFNNLYKKLTVDPDFTIKESKFDEIIKKLKNKNIGFEILADKYIEVAKPITKNGHVHLGKKDKPIKPLVDFVIAPFKFIYNTIKLPYSLSEKAVKGILKEKPKPENIAELKIKALSQSLAKIEKEMNRKNYSDVKFKDFMSDNISNAFNEENLSKLANHELANLAKTSATAATLWFLMTDNHNMVMLKSNGEDKKGAELKFKERFVQEGSRLFYQTLLIDLFNSTFRNQYNGSLLGMSLVTIMNTLTGEALTRKSIGMPIQKHSRDELIKIENKKENATGFAKSYFDFMTRLTGKKSLAEQNKAKQAKNEAAAAKA